MMDLMPHSSDFVLRSAVSLADQKNIGPGWDSAVKRSATGRRSRLWSSRVPRLPKPSSQKNTFSLHYLAFFPIVRHFLAGWLTLGPRPCPVCLHWKDQHWVPNSTEMLLELHLLHLLLPLLVAGDIQPIFNPSSTHLQPIFNPSSTHKNMENIALEKWKNSLGGMNL